VADTLFGETARFDDRHYFDIDSFGKLFVFEYGRGFFA
jgi:hypothetical protein